MVCLAVCVLFAGMACTAEPPQGVFACREPSDCPTGQRCFEGRCWTNDPGKGMSSSSVSEQRDAGAPQGGRSAPGQKPMDGCPDAGCAAPSCKDGAYNGTETDVDCGGPCLKCGLGKRCAAGGDCESARCTAGVCAAVSCSDAEKNGAETDVDCGGGACPACLDGRACANASDCQSAVCQTICRAATCSDRAKNGSETDVDCGGSCPRCSAGAACKVNSDCAPSTTCEAGRCKTIASCSDGVKNGQETAVDCGGPCACCPSFEIKADVQTASGWFGGDSRPMMAPRSEGTGTSVLVRQAGTLSRFAFYYTAMFLDGAAKSHAVTLVLQIRDGMGKVLQTARADVPASFGGGYVFWENLGFKLNAGNTYIFTSYLQDALSVGAWSGYAGDKAQGFVDGKGYMATVTDGDATFDDWSVWREQEWDRRFWLQACP